MSNSIKKIIVSWEKYSFIAAIGSKIHKTSNKNIYVSVYYLYRFDYR